MCAACRTVRIVQTVGGGALGSNSEVRQTSDSKANEAKCGKGKTTPHRLFPVGVAGIFVLCLDSNAKRKKKIQRVRVVVGHLIEMRPLRGGLNVS